MNQKTLGQTGLTISSIGLGLAALGRPGYITIGHADDVGDRHDVESMQAHASQVLDAAWDLGIRYFDAARSYGLAEQFLSQWLFSNGLKPDSLTVGSKWGYTYTANWQTQAAVHEVKDHSLPVLERQYNESRGLLNGYLKLYQVHSATLESGIFENPTVLNKLAHLKQDGLAIGLTLSGPKQSETLERAVTIIIDGQHLFDTVQVTWNLLERSTSAILQDVHAAGMGVIVKEALANGLLTSRNNDPRFADRLTKLHVQADRLHTTIDALALAGVMAQPWADVVLSGAATVDQLRSNIAALAVPWDAEAADSLADLIESPESYWDTRKNLVWN